MADIFLVDDHVMLREGLRNVLEKAGHRVVGEAGHPAAAIADIARLQPSVVLLDLHLEPDSGFDVLEEVQRRKLPSRVVMLTMSANPRHVVEALRRGALGYVLKDSASLELLNAVEVVANGHRYLCRRASTLAVEGLMAESRSAAVLSLSARERQVILMVVRGLTSAVISTKLDLSPKTVESYRARIMAKLGVDDVPALVRLAVREGLIGVED
ncbi:response regulator transcription factor [Hydrogenophaga sp. UC242_50]|jgi:two-component system invasion response regulator UvrY|uniref:response regulator transcription factor n=1 Tax=unclassified Hydrogenophaga TaxID=2610897 RepID=UPI0036D3EF65